MVQQISDDKRCDQRRPMLDRAASLRVAAASAPRMNPARCVSCVALIYWYLGYVGYVGYLSPHDAFSAGVLYAMRALEIDNTLGEPAAMLALYHKQVDYNWPEVNRAMARALELSPSSPIVRTRHAFNALSPKANSKRRVEELQRALEQDQELRTP